jgi:glutamate-1-semialdehyde 2,1-aminomutase
MARATSTTFDWSWDKRERESIAQGALTNSKRPSCLVRGVYPTHLVRGLGCHVWDTQGKQYVDFIGGLGCNILGYANAEVNAAVVDRLNKGATLSLATPLEVECAEKVKEIFPFIDRVKFLKTGSDACSAAIRIARAKTGRNTVLSDGYHGFHDLFVSLSTPALGVHDSFMIQKWDDHYLDMDNDQFVGGVAAVIVEPIMTEMSDSRRAWLQRLREWCTKAGALLIFDEVITGFRFPKLSVSNHYGVTPDLICLGKAMANGLPISVVGGKKDVMECGEYFVSSTFAGETLSLAAAIKTMTLLQTNKYDVNYLWEKGSQFIMAFNSIAPEIALIEGYPTRGVLKGEPLLKALFMQESCRAGLLFGPSWFFNFKHIDVMDSVLNTCADIMTRIKTGSVALQGELPASPFAQKMREQK